jgi:hypothetical protein
MRSYQDQYRDKLNMLYEQFDAGKPGKNPVCISVPQAAQAMGVAARTLRDDPTFPAFFVGKHRKVSLDSFARWLTDKERNKF